MELFRLMKICKWLNNVMHFDINNSIFENVFPQVRTFSSFSEMNHPVYCCSQNKHLIHLVYHLLDKIHSKPMNVNIVWWPSMKLSMDQWVVMFYSHENSSRIVILEWFCRSSEYRTRLFEEYWSWCWYSLYD